MFGATEQAFGWLMNFDSIGNIDTFDGTSLFYRYKKAENEKALILLVHGLSEHSGRYSHVIQFLAKNKYSSLAFDLRGHGLSGGKRGFIYSLNDYKKDICCIVKFLKNSIEYSKIFILAHSLGGLVASLYILEQQKKFDGLILSSPAFGMNMSIPWYKSFLGKMMSKAFPSFSLKSTILPEHLSKDEHIIKQYKEDPLIFNRITCRLYTEVLSGYEEIYKLASKISLPIFWQISGNDLVVSSEKSKEVYEKINSKDRELVWYENYLHEIYNEIGKEKPLFDLIKWLDKRCINIF